MLRRIGLGLCVIAVLAGLPSAAGAATTITVNTTNDIAAPGCTGGTCSIRQALAAASPGDTIVVPAGHYTLTLGELQVPNPVTLQGAGAGSTTIDAAHNSRVLEITSNSGLDMTIGGITLTNGTVTGATSNTGGAGIYVDPTYDGSPTLNGVTLTSNTVTATSGSNSGGAGIYDDGSGNMLTLTNSTVTSNTATVTGSSNNSGGGGIYNNNSDITLTNSAVSGNKATVNGGSHNNGGGGIYNNGNSIDLTGSAVDNNTLTLTSNTASNNGGGGIYNNGNVITLTRSSTDGNGAAITGTGFSGGLGIYNNGNNIALTAASISNNSGTIADSSTTNGVNGGGAIFNNGSATDTFNSTLSHNQLTVTSSVTPNTNGGGAILNDGSASTIVDTTISGNSINEPGGGLFTESAPFTIKNSILASNTATPSGSCAITSGSGFVSDGFNLEDANTCSLTLPSDHVNANPQLQALANNGGPTATQALGFGSPAIGAGSCTDIANQPVTTDQRGLPRPDSGDPAGTCDIGAFEVQPTANTAAATISGKPAVGQKLTCSPGTWTNPPNAFTYVWKRGGTAISGATASTYTVQIADAAKSITCTVTGSNPDGTRPTVTSAGVLIGNSRELNCPKPKGKLSGKKLGSVSLGMTLSKAKRALRRNSRGAHRLVDFCLYAGFDIEAATPPDKLLASLKASEKKRVNGKLVIALTTNPFYTLNKVALGTKVRAAKRKLKLGKAFRIGSDDWYLVKGKSSVGVVRVRGGIIVEIGIADRKLAGGSRSSQAKFLRFFA